jgi:hypothetical protein
VRFREVFLVFDIRKNPECVVHVSRVYKRGGVGVGWLAGWVVVVVVGGAGGWGGWAGWGGWGILERGAEGAPHRLALNAHSEHSRCLQMHAVPPFSLL